MDNQPWCYPSCPKCTSSVKFDVNIYTCKKEGTICPYITHGYKVCFRATDGTWESEFILFDERGISLIGKPAEKLLKQYNKDDIPPEINALVGEKLTVIVKFRPGKSFDNPDKEPTFDILSIKKRHGKDLITHGFEKVEHPPVVNTTSSSSINLPPLIPIQAKNGENQLLDSNAFSPHDIQLMEIDQTRGLEGITDANKEFYEDAQDTYPPVEKGMKKKD